MELTNVKLSVLLSPNWKFLSPQSRAEMSAWITITKHAPVFSVAHHGFPEDGIQKPTLSGWVLSVIVIHAFIAATSTIICKGNMSWTPNDLSSTQIYSFELIKVITVKGKWIRLFWQFSLHSDYAVEKTYNYWFQRRQKQQKKADCHRFWFSARASLRSSSICCSLSCFLRCLMRGLPCCLDLKNTWKYFSHIHCVCRETKWLPIGDQFSKAPPKAKL